MTIEPMFRRFIEYKYRKQAVITLTLLAGLVVVKPAVDEYTAARSRVKDTRASLQKTEAEIARIPQHEQVFQTKQSELQALEQRIVSDKTAQLLRNQLVQLVRKSGCTMRRIDLGDATQRDWTEKDDPIRGTRLADPGDDTPFQLVTRQLSLSITGSTQDIHKFLSQVHEIDKMMHTRTIALKQADRNRGSAALDLDVWLFDLVRKPES